jgi:hypothetical protein
MPTDWERERGVEHIVHDYATLVLTGEGIPKGANVGIHEPWNGPIEQSFIVSCRKFAHFFLNLDKKRRHDMFAKHFVDPAITFDLPTWELWCDHHDKHLFHLSYGRVHSTTPWDGYKENKMFFEELRAAWRKFLAVPPRFKDEFDKCIDAKEKQLANFGVKLR